MRWPARSTASSATRSRATRSGTSAFNTINGDTAEIFQKKEVRLPSPHAVDWEATITTAGGSVATPAKSSIASTVSYYKEVGLYEYDPELSKQLLAEAGYADGFEFTVTEEEVPLAIRVLETVQAYLAEIGITMNIEATDTPTWQEATQKGTSQATIANMTANTGDRPTPSTATFRPPPPPPVRSWMSTSTICSTVVSRSRTRPNARRSTRSCMDYIYENAFFIPMWEQVITYGIRDNLQGFTPDSVSSRRSATCPSPKSSDRVGRGPVEFHPIPQGEALRCLLFFCYAAGTRHCSR